MMGALLESLLTVAAWFPLWGCVLFAWWLSDGFKNVQIGGWDEPDVYIGIDPMTDEPCLVQVDEAGGETWLRS